MPSQHSADAPDLLAAHHWAEFRPVSCFSLLPTGLALSLPGIARGGFTTAQATGTKVWEFDTFFSGAIE